MILPHNIKGFGVILLTNESVWAYGVCLTLQMVAEKNDYLIPKSFYQALDPAKKFVAAGIIEEVDDGYSFKQNVFKRNIALKGNSNRSKKPLRIGYGSITDQLLNEEQDPLWIDNGMIMEPKPNDNGMVMEPPLINNKIIRKINTPTLENDHSELAAQIIDSLNKILCKNFKADNKQTQKFLQARINEGYALEDFEKVFKFKKLEWEDDTVMSKFLRPATLLGTKFGNYLEDADNDTELNVEAYLKQKLQEGKEEYERKQANQ